ncbi:hypothetical protein [Rhodoplanes sp. Z2-YC6860]|uniref:hypothetical protein n=1 Tax=Rhodoplanes sp. Z2-YC6860 TaxID=674703 RepID=UPI00078D133D|nr:hypothetical protein [Rhodoplanes sp. Z2-YC6860]AMN42829.1 hypothetical protein RHPLAN_44000 [Rhodoplanes sp. Z2-YC6860]
MTKTAAALALLLSLGASSAHAAPAGKPDFLGKWTIVSSQPAPWSKPGGKPVASDLKALIGHDVTFRKDRIDAPSPLRCRKPHYEIKAYTPDLLFQGSLTDPDKQATALGYGKSMATLETGCEGAFDFHFLDNDSAMFGLNNRLYRLERKKP